MMKTLIPLILAALVCSAPARVWKNSAGKTFEADYISNDGKRVTLRGKKRIVTFKISKLHRDDQVWLKKNHPVDPNAEEAAPKGAAFDTLEFGDSKDEVIKKLRKSKLVDGDVVETLIARTGMDGIYRTRNKIGGLQCSLYFEWTSGNTLREISFRTEGLPEHTYGNDLKTNWSEWIKLLSMIHGKPIQNGRYPDINDLEDGLSLGSHIWHTEDSHSVILGTGQDGRKYSAVVRITSELIQPKRF